MCRYGSAVWLNSRHAIKLINSRNRKETWPKNKQVLCILEHLSGLGERNDLHTAYISVCVYVRVQQTGCVWPVNLSMIRWNWSAWHSVPVLKTRPKKSLNSNAPYMSTTRRTPLYNYVLRGWKMDCKRSITCRGDFIKVRDDGVNKGTAWISLHFWNCDKVSCETVIQ